MPSATQARATDVCVPLPARRLADRCCRAKKKFPYPTTRAPPPGPRTLRAWQRGRCTLRWPPPPPCARGVAVGAVAPARIQMHVDLRSRAGVGATLRCNSNSISISAVDMSRMNALLRISAESLVTVIRTTVLEKPCGGVRADPCGAISASALAHFGRWGRAPATRGAARRSSSGRAPG